MADSKISALNSAAALDGSEVLPIVQGGETKKITQTDLTKEFLIKGTRLEANVSAIYNIDLGIASDFHLTLTANTVFTFINLPTGTDVVRCKLRLTGAFVPTFSQGWLQVFGADYDGAKWNDVIVEISNGNSTFEIGELIFQQRETA